MRFEIKAEVAQLVEHHLAKVDVASSSLVNRSTKPPKVKTFGGAFVLSLGIAVRSREHPMLTVNPGFRSR